MIDRTIRLHAPGSDEYAAATRPQNTLSPQRPAFVAVPETAEEAAAAVREAVSRGLRVVPQATGHGAAAPLGDDVLLVSTARLDSIRIDAEGALAVVGTGATWGAVNAAAEPHGLLGRAGSAPSVGVAGYTFDGGIGWLSRPHGTAAAGLRRVEYVDGAGRLRTAAEDAADDLDRDALWAFRGGGGVGIATSLEFALVPVRDLWAGYLLWPVDALHAVAAAWGAAVDDVGPAVATSLAVLHLPPAPDFPEELQGRPAVHLALASSEGPDGAAVLLDAVRSAAGPVVDTWGRADAARLAQIHLDPPGSGPAIGEARWLGPDAPSRAADVLGVAASPDSPLVQVEVRSVGAEPSGVPGAMTDVLATFVLHAVGPAPDDGARGAARRALDAVREAARPVDAGLAPASWIDGATAVPDALPTEVQARVRRIADAVDPEGVLARSTIAAGASTDGRADGRTEEGTRA